MSDTEQAGLGARRAALRLLDAVLRQGLPLESALARATEDLERADDRAFVHAIAAATLRRLADLDALIDSATPKPLPHDAKARAVLRIALVQALALGTPPHAVIATVLPLVEGGPKRLVHGVFGTLMRNGATLPDLPALPPFVAKRWRKAWGAPVCAAAQAMLVAPPPLDLSLRDPSATAEWAERLGGVSLAPDHVRLARVARVADLPGFAEGAWWVQDIAASLPARLLGAGDGRSVLDLCAAPGGKTLQLAAAGWRVTALDLSEARLGRLAENLARIGLKADLVAADLMAFAARHPGGCGAAGRALLGDRHLPPPPRRAAPGARPRRRRAGRGAGRDAGARGRLGEARRHLVYSVCSLEKAEGEGIADAFAADRRFVRDPVVPDELPAGITPGGAGRVRVLPGMLAEQGGADGFFVARFRRVVG